MNDTLTHQYLYQQVILTCWLIHSKVGRHRVSRVNSSSLGLWLGFLQIIVLGLEDRVCKYCVGETLATFVYTRKRLTLKKLFLMQDSTQLRLSDLASGMEDLPDNLAGNVTPPLTPKSMQKHLIKKYQEKQVSLAYHFLIVVFTNKLNQP